MWRLTYKRCADCLGGSLLRFQILEQYFVLNGMLVQPHECRGNIHSYPISRERVDEQKAALHTSFPIFFICESSSFIRSDRPQ